MAGWFFVVDTSGVQHGGPHPSREAALLAQIELMLADDADCGDRYRILAAPASTDQPALAPGRGTP